MQIGFYVTPVYRIHLDADTLAALMRASSLHYDSVCKAASKPGGFLHTWDRIEKNIPGHNLECSVGASSSEVNLLMKICELESTIGGNVLLLNLTMALNQAWNRVNMAIIDIKSTNVLAK